MIRSVMRHFGNLILSVLPPSRLFWLRSILLQFFGVDIGEKVSFCGRGWIYGRGTLSIGNRSWLSPGVIFFTHVEAPIVIGTNCDIGPGVKFVVGSHEIGDSNRRAGKGTANPITIGDGCWLGAGCLILGGVSIGPGAVIAAGAVVTKDVFANTLVAGVPAIEKYKITK
jgi:maltose O-acetyltransferase